MSNITPAAKKAPRGRGGNRRGRDVTTIDDFPEATPTATIEPEQIIDVQQMDTDPVIATTQGDASISPILPNDEQSLQEQLQRIQQELHQSLEARNGELQARNEDRHEPSGTAAAPKTSTPPRSQTKTPAAIPSWTKAPTVAFPKVSSAVNNDVDDTVRSSGQPSTADSAEHVQVPRGNSSEHPRAEGHVTSVQDAFRLWREDVERMGVESHRLQELIDRSVNERIASLNYRTERERPIPVPPKANGKEPTATRVTNPAPTTQPNPVVNPRIVPPESSNRNLHDARKDQTCKQFNPTLGPGDKDYVSSRVWRELFHSLCENYSLTDEQAITLLRERLPPTGLALYNTTQKGQKMTLNLALEWFGRTYPASTSRLGAQRAIQDCQWDLRKPAATFIADFNHAFLLHPRCDEQTKIHLLLQKLPTTMRAQAELQLDHLDSFAMLTQWIVDHENLKATDMTTVPAKVNAINNYTASSELKYHEVDTAPRDYADMLAALRAAGVCFNCGQRGHIAAACEQPPVGNRNRNDHYDNNRGDRGGYRGRGGRGGYRGRGRGYYSGRGGYQYNQGEAGPRQTLGKRRRED